MQPRRTLAAAVLAAAAVAAWTPATRASTTQTAGLGALTPWPAASLAQPFAAPAGGAGGSGCGPAHGNEGQGGNGGSEDIVCAGVALVFIGPSVGGINNVIGPTIISPGFAGVVITSNGNSAVGP
jgi:hypothetical protein